MRSYVDHVLSILPFEPAVMAELGGPETHYVGHRLMADDALQRCWEANTARTARADGSTVNLLLLPGSRRSEVRALLDDFRQAVDIMRERGNALSITLPTLPHLERQVRDHVLGWPDVVRVTTGRDAQIEAYGTADVAIAASGTVLLELALAGVPAISCYRSDPLIRRVAERLLTTWSAALPNVIADRPVINEYYDEMIHPGMLARLEFADCEVPADQLLGRPGFGLAQIVGSVLDHGRYCIAWGAAGLARRDGEAQQHGELARERLGGGDADLRPGQGRHGCGGLPGDGGGRHVDHRQGVLALPLGVAQGGQGVGGLARLRDHEGEPVPVQRRLAVARLRGDVDLDGQARALAAGFRAHGLRAGDRVALMLPTGSAFFAAFLGTLMAGGVPVKPRPIHAKLSR